MIAPLRVAATALRATRPTCDEATADVDETQIVSFSEAALAQLEGMREKAEDGQLVLRMGGARP